MTIVERARLLIAKSPAAISGQGGHGATYRVACALVWGFGLSPDEAFPLMMEFNAVCDPPWSEHELWHKLRSALAGTHREQRGHFLTEKAELGTLPAYEMPKRAKAVEFDAAALEKAQRADLKVDHAWLRERSPYDPKALRAGDIIDRLYEREDRVMLFTSMASRGDYMRWRGGWYRLGKTPDVKAVPCEKIPEGSPEGMIWLVQPVDGKWKPKSGTNVLSRRTKQNITRYPFLLLESDKAPPDLWLNVMVTLDLPIVLMTTSGGRSIHALVKIGSETHDEWLSIVGMVRDRMAKIGCDRQALTNPAVNVRCANTWRDGKTIEGKFVPFTYGRAVQRCLYFNPNAMLSAIIKNPRFDHAAISA
jgi:hypothetical protein